MATTTSAEGVSTVVAVYMTTYWHSTPGHVAFAQGLITLCVTDLINAVSSYCAYTNPHYSTKH